MKLTTRKQASLGEQRRNRRLIDRTLAPALRAAYPQLASVRIDLSFSAEYGRAPSAQAHSYFPSARAFFRFACPGPDCDSEFDLTQAVAEASTSGAVQPLKVRVSCAGLCHRGRTHDAPCPISLTCQIVATPVSAAA